MKYFLSQPASILKSCIKLDYYFIKNPVHCQFLLEMNAEEILSHFVCVFRGACLECVLPGVQVTAGLGFFLCSSHLGNWKLWLPTLTGLAFSVDL